MAKIKGSNGKDMLWGTNHADTIFGRGGDDTIFGRGGNDKISGDDGNDKIFGGAGNDHIHGGKGDDKIFGGSGNDHIHGGSGNDKLFGGSGNDWISGGSGNDHIHGGSGNDRIDGGSGNDRINGGSGNDWIFGGAGNDHIHGGSGNDKLFGGEGNDFLDGGCGNDTIYGGSGNDLIYGGAGNDWIDGGSGNDWIYGGAGNDWIFGGEGNDYVDGGTGNDRIFGGAGNDHIHGGSGNDWVDGGSGNDWIDGGKGNDVVDGGTGKDSIFGGKGDDELVGGAGADWLTGGSGNDKFVFLTAADSTAACGWDRIADFAQGKDRIDLSALLGPTDLAWGNKTAMASAAWYQNSGSSTFVFADTTGDAAADLKIELKHTSGLKLTVNDFIGVGNAPVITSNGGGDSAAVSVAENTTAVTTVTAIDPDAGAVLTFSIVGGADQAKFSIVGATGVLTFNFAPDFETPTDAGPNNVYDVLVQVSDGQGGFDTQAIAVTVTDVNEAPTAVSFDNTTTAVDENTDTSAGLKVADIVVVDDALGNETLALTGADAASFEIVGSELRLKAGVLDFETKNSYSVQVTADDTTVGGSPDATSALFTVNVTDVNDVAPAFTSGGAASIAENTPAANVIYTAAAFDPDTVGTVAFSLTGADAGLFSIGATTGDVRFLASPDFEAPADAGSNNVYDIVVHANDGVHQTTKAVAITVTDVDEPPVSGNDNVFTDLALGTAFNVPEWALLANDSDPEKSAIDVQSVGGETGLTAVHTPGVGTNGFVTVTDTDLAGGSFTYTATDGVLTGTPATVNVTQVNGGTPNSTYSFALNAGNNIIRDSSGIDTIIIEANGAALSSLNFEKVGTDFVIQYNGQQVTVLGQYTGAGDQIENIQFAGGASFHGYALGTGTHGLLTFNVQDFTTNTDDVMAIVSTIGNTLFGAGGNDLLFGDDGDNTLGFDTFPFVETGNDLLVGRGGNDTLRGGPGNDVLIGGAGNDTLTGGADSDIFDYNALSDRGTTGDTITDFQTGTDDLDLHDLLVTFGIPGGTGNAFDGGYLQFIDDPGPGTNTLVQVDSDGGGNSFVTLATVNGVLLDPITNAGDFIL